MANPSARTLNLMKDVLDDNNNQTASDRIYLPK
jgi:hypothetical protein